LPELNIHDIGHLIALILMRFLAFRQQGSIMVANAMLLDLAMSSVEMAQLALTSALASNLAARMKVLENGSP
jgi:hypothetical protein